MCQPLSHLPSVELKMLVAKKIVKMLRLIVKLTI